MSRYATKAGPFTQIIMGTVFLVTGVALHSFIGKPTMEKCRASLTWPTTDGKIVSARVVSKVDDGKTMYRPQIVFNYRVGGAKHESSKISMGGGMSASNSSWAQNKVNQYAAGKSVQVAYNPATPAEGVLEPGTNVSSYVLYAVGPGMALVGFLIAGWPIVALTLALVAMRPSKTSRDESHLQRGNTVSRPPELPTSI